MKTGVTLGLVLATGIAGAAVYFALAGTRRHAALDEAATSHINADVPAQSLFDPALRRDLLAYFGGERVEYTLLRAGPTQSGTAHPKYYAWVKIAGRGEGAVRLAAVGGNHFEVTDFVSLTEVRERPSRLNGVFPEALMSEIQRHARQQ